MKIKKIYILGTSGSGKTHLAKAVSEKLKIPHYDLDNIYWIKKYSQKRSRPSRLKKAKELSKKNEWVIEGVYGSWAIDILKKADKMLWLETPFTKRSYRILKRYYKNKKGPANNLKDTLKLIGYSAKYKLGKHSQGYKAHKKILQENKINYIELKNNKQINEFLETLK